MDSKVFVRFQKVGLGNKLLTWSRAYVFAQLNGLELHTSPWFSFFVGVWLRRENKKRLYLGYFKKSNAFKNIRFIIYRLFYKKVFEPEIIELPHHGRITLFIFDRIYREWDFYKEIRPYKSLVKQGLHEMLEPSLLEILHLTEKPVIGIHIRRGDFKFSNTITPVEFFIEVIQEIRRQTAVELPVTVFTDANREEIADLLKLKNVRLAAPRADVIDILLLASSEYLITSISSTFSYWAAFLSDGIIIKPEKEWHDPLRAQSDILFVKEVKWPGLPLPIAVQNILKAR